MTPQPTIKDKILGYWPVVAFFIGMSIAGIVSFTVTRVTADMTVKNIEEVKKESADRDKVIFNKVRIIEDMATRHDAIIPRIENHMDKIENKLDRILTEVRK